MSSKPATERELIHLCMTLVCKAAGFHDGAGLVQRDLQYICDSIESKTGVLISLSTLRRLLNGEFSRLPQVATLDAIARFAGYAGWQGFRIVQLGKEEGGESVSGGMNEHDGASGGGGRTAVWALRGRGWKRKAGVVAAAVVLVLVAVGLLSIRQMRKSGPRHVEKAQFSAVKVTRNDLPNTVVFQYDIDGVDADSFFIQQSWDKNRRVRIYKHTHTLTDIYYEPGYHRAKLIANDSVIKVFPVSIPTDRWLFYSKDSGFFGMPHYIVPAAPVKDGALQLSPEDVTNSKIRLADDNTYFLVYFPSRIESSSDSFTLNIRIRVQDVNDAACLQFMTEIFCQKYFMFFQHAPKGCTSILRAEFGENLLDGRTYDLSAMGLDVKSWQNIQLQVAGKKATVRVNGVETLSMAYHKSCGLITGLGLISNGLCQVESVDLRGADGKVVYHGAFNK